MKQHKSLNRFASAGTIQIVADHFLYNDRRDYELYLTGLRILAHSLVSYPAEVASMILDFSDTMIRVGFAA